MSRSRLSALDICGVRGAGLISIKASHRKFDAPRKTATLPVIPRVTQKTSAGVVPGAVLCTKPAADE
jgi:hypothetical protein